MINDKKVTISASLLYLAFRGVDRGSLVLSHFQQILETLQVYWRNSKQRFASIREWRNENMESNPQPVGCPVLYGQNQILLFKNQENHYLERYDQRTEHVVFCIWHGISDNLLIKNSVPYLSSKFRVIACWVMKLYAYAEFPHPIENWTHNAHIYYRIQHFKHKYIYKYKFRHGHTKQGCPFMLKQPTC